MTLRTGPAAELALGLLQKTMPDQAGEALFDVPLFSSGRLNSLAFVRILAAVEDEAEAEVAEADLVTANFDSVRAIEAIVQRYRAGG